MRVRNEAGNGCLALALIVAALFVLLVMCTLPDSTDDCYAVGEPGSAQGQRDLERCIGK